ncbi:MAG: methylmalonyl-CoA epimerase [Rhodothermales bacterium]|nr:methylmalonyl-CoA epimerase [Rhodothermales bacterium]
MASLEHIGIAVRNADTATRLYDLLLGLIPYKVEEVESESVVTYFLDAGGTKLEFLSSDDPESAIGRFLGRHGPGLHHIAFEVEDLQDACVRAVEAGIRVLGDGPSTGADGKNVVFLHPKDTHGVLIEFCKAARPLWRKVEFSHSTGAKRYFTAGSAGNPVLLIVNSQFKSGLGQLIPKLESAFHVFGIESASDFPIVPEMIRSETQHASDIIYLLTTQQQATSVASVMRDPETSLSVAASIVVCGASAVVSAFADLPNLLIASTEQPPGASAYEGLPVAILPHPVSSDESTFLDWLLLVLKGYFRSTLTNP